MLGRWACSCLPVYLLLLLIIGHTLGRARGGASCRVSAACVLQRQNVSFSIRQARTRRLGFVMTREFLLTT